MRKGRDYGLYNSSLIPPLELLFRNSFDLFSQYNSVRILRTHSLQKRNRIRIMIDQFAFTYRRELTLVCHYKLCVQIFVCLYILIHDSPVRINRKWRKGAGYCLQ